MTEILKIKGDWEEVVNDCRSTVGKAELGKEPSKAFKRSILIAEHSPIRDIIVKWRWKGVKSWVATHWVRHKWEKYVTTQRDDRTGVSRDDLPQSPLIFRISVILFPPTCLMSRPLCRGGTCHKDVQNTICRDDHRWSSFCPGQRQPQLQE